MEIFTYRAVEPDKKVYFLYAPTMKRVIMRMSIIIFILAFGFVHAAGNADAQQVTLTVKDEKLADVFRKLREQTGYLFNFRYSQVDKFKVSFSVENTTIVKALDQCLEGLPLTYTLTGKIIVIRKKASQDTIAQRQPFLIRGVVTNREGLPLPGVTVKVKRSSVGTITDNEGRFSIRVSEGDELELSMLGYQHYSIKVNGQVAVNAVLAESISGIDEVVVKGYYTTTKALNTGNVSSVKAEDIVKQPVGDPLAALQGLVPGLFVQQSSGAPGRAFNISLRGQNSLRQNVQNVNDPLYIIDGVPFNSTPLNSSNFVPGANAQASPLNDISISDIESIEVLKDADATAIYGSRGANGVVLINTKRGRAGKTNVTLNAYKGVGAVTRRLDLLNTEEYLEMRRQAFENDNAQPGAADYDLNGSYDQSEYTDWQEKLIGGTADVSDAQISISGGGQLTQFRIAGSFRQESTVYPVDFPNKKGSGSFTISHLSENKKLRLNFGGTYVANQNKLPTSDLTQYIFLAPNSPEIYLPDGNLNWANGTWQNPLQEVKQRYREAIGNLMSNFDFNYEIIPRLNISAKIGYTKNTMESSRVVPFSALNPAFTNPASRRINRRSYTARNLWTIEPQLNYKTKLWIGEIEALVGTTLQSAIEDRSVQAAAGYSTDALIDNLALGTTRSILEDSRTQYRYNSIFGRLGYNIQDKYLINLTGRRDGSSRFGPGRKFGNFGAVGVAWLFSNEDWVASTFSILSFGKIRGSFGIAGSDRLEDYRYLSTYSGVSSNLSYQGIAGLTATQLTNPLYSWEAVKKLELALELGFVDDRLRLNASWYKHRTDNQLVGFSLPDATGFSQVQANLPAVIQNKGLELDVSTRNIEQKNFRWTTSANISIPQNELVSYPNIESSGYATRYAVGYPLTVQYRYIYTGLDPQTGLYTFEDINKDGSITFEADRVPVFIGPKFFGGISNSLVYKDWKLDFMFSFAKQSAENIYFNLMPGGFWGGKGNQPKSILNGKDLQPFSQTFGGSIFPNAQLFTQSDATIADASYVRLKNVSLAWSLPSQWKSKSFLSAATVYVQCQNLLTFTNYKGLDPENPFVSVPWLPPLRTITVGLSVGF